MEPVKPLSLQLPTNRTVDVVVVKLSDGRIVARSREELAAAPAVTLPSTLKP